MKVNEHLVMKVSRPEVTFVIPSMIALATLSPYLIFFNENGLKINIVATVSVKSFLQTYYHESFLQNVIIEDLTDYRRRYRLRGLCHKILLIIFTPRNYSVYYDLRLKNALGYISRTNLFKYFNGLTSIKGNKVSDRVSFIMRFLFKNPFRTPFVITSTVVGASYLMSSRKLKVITILESWDHPIKIPKGYLSELVLVWNEDLARDWLLYQDNSKIRFAYPVKLGYVIERGKTASVNLVDVNQKLNWLYPATFSSFSRSIYYQEELQIVKQIADFVFSRGDKLILKCKPNTSMMDFIELEDYKGITIIRDDSSSYGSGDYFLSDEYNQKRLDILDKSDILINLGTTFAFEGALIGLPIVQFDLDKTSESPLYRIYEEYHLKQYFVDDCEKIFHVENIGNIKFSLNRAVNELESLGYNSRPYLMREKLFSFISSRVSLEESFNAIINVLERQD
jgi:hypothetical protein